MQQISVARLFDGQNWQQNVTLTIEADRIHSIQSADGAVLQGTLVPGFIDVQVNGGGGALFNTNTSLEALRTMVKAHAQFGSTALLPTVITDSVAVMQQAADVVAQAIASKEPGILGVHFEGPHLSVPKKGVHPEPHIRPLSAAELAIYRRTDLGIKLVTVAPENIGPEQIKELVEANVIVCLGHSNADAVTVQAALAAGATGFTHLYNAMSPLTSREPGVVGAALADPHSWCGIILDGFHVHPLAVKVALAAKPKGKLLIVTDAMSPVGTSQTEFDFFDGKVIRNGNKLTNLNGNLAGSVLDMASAVSYAVKELGLDLSEAVRMASLYPAEFLSISTQRGQIKAGAKADLVLLSDEGLVQQCWLEGRAFIETR
ncbi:N-acetylglucosamine-6-phosphate deacetylase [Rheinheimera sediminis]|uniref:N-acetylglucosamine-6-phosphate deacetylase n=1 Tax=Rheinheimera sp. YQF-1 TaxID=2499626 RepID=UPI000FDB134D|nr:N-acetylglucosamine-6-phosphate deacetylase [Rheinheimera sp. YQF-1]RVT47798.1 N-acetylglucosamine-6-phosphate deacetylase [Rheinheimera sp. YQF-1]